MPSRFAQILLLAACLTVPSAASAQGQPDFSGERYAHPKDNFQWIVGSYLPLSALGSFGAYDITVDPWITVGVSGRAGKADRRLRTRFEMTLTPNATMRRTSESCADCTSESLRLNMVNWRFLVDLTAGLPDGSRAYVTAGPFMRVQLGRSTPCSRSSGDDCALVAFARSRVDPGLMVGLGWEPEQRRIGAIQLAGRLSYFGRDVFPEARPASWIRALELSVHVPF